MATTPRPSTRPASTRSSSPCRRASTSISRCRRSPPASTCWSRSPPSRRWPTTTRCATARDRAGRVVIVGENDHYKPLAVTLRRLLAERVVGDLVFAHFTTIAHRLKTADDWRNDEAMAGGDAFFEEGIHWLHVAGSLGPTITRAHGYRPAVSRDGPDRRAKSLLVAFEYDSRRRGHRCSTRARSRRCCAALRLSKLFGREASSPSSPMAASSWRAVAADCRGSSCLASATSAATRRCIAISCRGIRTGRPPEMRLERAIEDQRLMDQIMATARRQTTPVWRRRASARRMRTHRLRRRDHRFGRRWRHDGARPGVDRSAHPAHRARRRGAVGARELEPGGGLEGPALPHDRALARCATGEFQPYTHYNVGGNTKYWGSVLYRLRREDFGEIAHIATACRRRGRSPTRISRRGTTRPSVCTTCTATAAADPTEPPRGPYPHPPVPHADAMQPVIAGLRRQGLHPSPLPLGLIEPGLPDGCQLCNTCNSFPCRIHRKSDADVCCVRPAAARPA